MTPAAPFETSAVRRWTRDVSRALACLLAVLLFGLASTPSTASAAPDRTPSTYKVSGGDTLWDISQKFGVSCAELRKLNRLKSDVVKPGQTLKLRRGAKTAKSTSKAKSKSTSKAKSKSKSKKRNKSSAKSSKSKKKKKRGQKIYYKVRRGDYLIKIAKKNRTTIEAIRRLNSKKKLKRLRPGETIVVGYRTAGSGRSKLKRAVQLPESGPGYKAPRRARVWGTRTCVQSIQKAAAEVARLYPGTQPLYVGDVSFEHGGYMPPHKSHRTGRDADISYYVNGNHRKSSRFGDVRAKDLDAEKTWSLFQAFLDTGDVESIYVDYRLQKPLYEEARSRGLSKSALKRLFEYPAKRGSGRTKVIRHIRGHDDHFHIRFKKQPGDEEES